MGYWAEIRNDYTTTDIMACDGDALAITKIDAWPDMDDDESGEVIADVILTRHGDVAVSYHTSRAISDDGAQEAIADAKKTLQQEYGFFLQAYNLYKDEWIAEHISDNRFQETLDEWEETVVNDDIWWSFEEFLDDQGFSGELYACFDEFLENELIDCEDHYREVLEREGIPATQSTNRDSSEKGR